ncbi:MAG: hypothetical protein K0S32_980 [Bacteroidetes bacterium]|jgi:hypothetical protein|nr:hypothetical protein [Bacteroidota bacterium]
MDIEIMSIPAPPSFTIRSERSFNNVVISDASGSVRKEITFCSETSCEICMKDMEAGPYVIELMGRGLYARMRLKFGDSVPDLQTI